MKKLTRILIGLAVITIISFIGVRSFNAYQGSSALEKELIRIINTKDQNAIANISYNQETRDLLMSLPKDVNVTVTDIQGARWVDSQGTTWISEPQGPHHLTAYFGGRIDGNGAALYADRDAESSFFVKVFPKWKISQIGLR